MMRGEWWGADLTAFFVVARWNSCLSPFLLFLSITAGVMRLPWACSATEASISVDNHLQDTSTYITGAVVIMNNWKKEENENSKKNNRTVYFKTASSTVCQMMAMVKLPFLKKCFLFFHLTWHIPITFAFLPTVPVLNAPTVWLRKPQFSVNLLEKDHAKYSTPFPINDAALGSKVVNDYQEGCFISQDEVYTASVSHSRIDNYYILYDPLSY